MTKNKNGFWTYLEKWRGLFPRPRMLRWRNGWLQNGYCRDCRYCCGPQDSDEPFPMPLLPRQLHENMDDSFYMQNAHTACMDGRGCKACTATGCGLPRAARPVSCGLFPFVLAGGAMYAYMTCPAVLLNPPAKVLPLGLEAARWLATFNLEDLHRLSLTIAPPVLAEKYVSLHLQVFDQQGVNLKLR